MTEWGYRRHWGVGLGFWWTDAIAAAVISLSILKDGFKNIRSAAAELLDGAPARSLVPNRDEARRLRERLEARWPEGRVRLRKSGRYILADVGDIEPPQTCRRSKAGWARSGLAARGAQFTPLAAPEWTMSRQR